MSTDAWIEEHWISEALLSRPRRAPKLPALPVPHAPTCSRGHTALAAHAQSRDSARHPGDRLSARQDGRNVVDQQARKLTQPAEHPEQSGEPTGIQLMTAKFYDDSTHDHVHTIAYVAPGAFVRHQSLTFDTQGAMRTTRFSEDASSYVFTNKKHPDLNDPRYGIFK
jgi:hypothetical protein